MPFPTVLYQPKLVAGTPAGDRRDSDAWHHAVAAALRILGLSQEQHFQNYHPVINRAVWSSLDVSRALLMALLGVVADSSFAVIALLARMASLPEPVYMMVRFRLDAALYAPAPERKAGQPGRPRQKGKRLPTLQQVAADATTAWQTVTISNWYGQRHREVEIVSDTAIWYHRGMPPLLIRWVLIRDPHGKFQTQAILSSEVSLDPCQILL